VAVVGSLLYAASGFIAEWRLEQRRGNTNNEWQYRDPNGAGNRRFRLLSVEVLIAGNVLYGGVLKTPPFAFKPHISEQTTA
jgi:hypothetical protein